MSSLEVIYTNTCIYGGENWLNKVSHVETPASSLSPVSYAGGDIQRLSLSATPLIQTFYAATSKGPNLFIFRLKHIGQVVDLAPLVKKPKRILEIISSGY